MKRKITLIALAFLSLLFVSGWISYGQKARPPKASSLQLWEYKIVQVDSEAKLNELGAQGWELVGFEGIEQGSNIRNCVLKRIR